MGEGAPSPARELLREAFRETLAGLSRLHVQVEPLNADAEREGLSAEALRADVEIALGRAGLGTVGLAELVASVPGMPVLRVDLMTLRLDGRYAYSLRLELWQAVRLVREPRTRALAMTWSSRPLLGTVAPGHLHDIARAVRALAEEFAAEIAPAPADDPDS